MTLCQWCQLHCVGDECGSDFVSVVLGGELVHVHCVSVTNTKWPHV